MDHRILSVVLSWYLVVLLHFCPKSVPVFHMLVHSFRFPFLVPIFLPLHHLLLSCVSQNFTNYTLHHLQPSFLIIYFFYCCLQTSPYHFWFSSIQILSTFLPLLPRVLFLLLHFHVLYLGFSEIPLPFLDLLFNFHYYTYHFCTK